MEQLLTEVRVRDWVDAEDAQIQEDMNKVDRWKSRKFKVGENFQEYQGMVDAWHHDWHTLPGSDYKNLETEVEDFYSDFGVINKGPLHGPGGPDQRRALRAPSEHAVRVCQTY